MIIHRDVNHLRLAIQYLRHVAIILTSDKSNTQDDDDGDELMVIVYA